MSSIINIAICDDEKIQVELLEKHVLNWANEKIYRKNTEVIEKTLDENIFVSCHRSYIVGLKHIRKIGKDNIELDNSHVIPVSRRQYSKII
ncbi:LytTR family transcriptional regulator [Tissierella sp. MSJ-40]|uniref:LytTR family transcriptional regulator n=1 Tax=Tissierella simiarum TaxID=2841534 RepID=A0ABS6E5G4_9FIRM|nr:LytTR family DNA-binding domain-containing protein [Tissierella simiarum]MBU5438071.1 LytTR family transcriptional regulator [Tissierella simiarum]